MILIRLASRLNFQTINSLAGILIFTLVACPTVSLGAEKPCNLKEIESLRAWIPKEEKTRQPIVMAESLGEHCPVLPLPVADYLQKNRQFNLAQTSKFLTSILKSSSPFASATCAKIDGISKELIKGVVVDGDYAHYSEDSRQAVMKSANKFFKECDLGKLDLATPVEMEKALGDVHALGILGPFLYKFLIDNGMAPALGKELVRTMMALDRFKDASASTRK